MNTRRGPEADTARSIPPAANDPLANEPTGQVDPSIRLSRNMIPHTPRLPAYHRAHPGQRQRSLLSAPTRRGWASHVRGRRSKPGANDPRPAVTSRHGPTRTRSSDDTRRHCTPAARTPRPPSGRRVPLWGGRVSPVVPPHFAVGLSLGLNSAPFKLPPLFPLPS